ncbi:MAG: amidohydrolase [Proteobacteria bacterium]|nr:amidohydrolase [Pseudomonadota bacterium]
MKHINYFNILKIKTLLLTLLVFSFPASTTTIYLKNITAYSHNGNELIKFSELMFDDESGKIVEITDANIKGAKLVDGQGKIILTGLHDAHGHVLHYGLSKLKAELRDIDSLDKSLGVVRKYHTANPDFPWILGSGWNQVLWQSKAFPTRYDLDQISQHTPIWLTRIDGHAGWANSAALNLAGINRETAKNNDLILKDAEGVPTGILVDNAMYLLESKIPPTSLEVKKQAITLTLNELAKQGITTIHDAGISHENYEIYKEMAKNQRLSVRIYAMLDSNDPKLLDMLKMGRINIGDKLFIQSVKLMIDGALGSYGAIMHQPYSDKTDQHGAYVQTPEMIKTLLDAVISYNFQANIHAIGDKGNTEVLNLLIRPEMKSKELRHRLEHAQILRLKDLSKLKNHNIIASVQPTHATSDMNMAEDRVGAERVKGAYAWNSMIKAGITIASGSDFPVEEINPFYGLHAAVTRQDRKNQPGKGWYSNEAMTIEDAFQSFTINASIAAHTEHLTGSLEPGKYADFIVVDQDIFTVNKQDIWKTKVLETWVDGKIVSY